MTSLARLCSSLSQLTLQNLKYAACRHHSVYTAAGSSNRILLQPPAPHAPLTSLISRNMASLWAMHRKGPPVKKRSRVSPMDRRPFLKGVVLKTLIKKPKKPNSANRKCVRVRLSTGREVTAYIPGIGHNLQEHHIVLVRGGNVQDLPGVKHKCVRGKYDLQHVKAA